MAATHQPIEKVSTDEITADEARQIGVFGVDQDGRLHRFDAMAGRLVVTSLDNEILYHYELGHESLLEDWVPYVGGRSGWVDCWADAEHYTDVAGRLARAIEAYRQLEEEV